METNEELITLARRLPELFQEAQLGETRYLEEDDLAALDATGYAAVAVAQKLADALEAAPAAAGVTLQEPGDREKRALDRVWKAMGCAWNPDAYRPRTRDAMWDHVVKFCVEQTAGNNRLHRENEALRASPVQVDEAKLPTVTRVKLAGRAGTLSAEHWDYAGVELLVQDNGRTLKVLPLRGGGQ